MIGGDAVPQIGTIIAPSVPLGAGSRIGIGALFWRLSREASGKTDVVWRLHRLNTQVIGKKAAICTRPKSLSTLASSRMQGAPGALFGDPILPITDCRMPSSLSGGDPMGWLALDPAGSA